MRTPRNGTKHSSHLPWLWTAAAGLVLLAAAGIAPTAKAQKAAPAEGTAEEPQGLPPANWPTSPHRGVIDGWTGKPIPCRCRFNGKAYQLGEIVCMRTHVGVVLTRCDIFGNNTSWVPSREPCQPDAGT